MPAKDPGTKDVDERIKALDDWRGPVLQRLRRLILKADPGMQEEIKWRKPSNRMLGVPVWSHDGIVATGEPYKDKVKVTFSHGAALPDPTKLFNAGFGGGTRRAFDVHEGDTIDTAAFQALVKAAVAFNQAKRDGATPKKKAPKRVAKKPSTKATKKSARKAVKKRRAR